MEHWDGPIRMSDEGPVMGPGAKGSGQVVGSPCNRKRDEAMDATRMKPYNIDKKLVYDSYKAVKANAGAAGVDRQTCRSAF